MSQPKKGEEVSYFTATLGQASELPPTNFTTVNELINKQAEKNGDNFACGFPVPIENGPEWGFDLLTYGDLLRYSLAAAGEFLTLIPGTHTKDKAPCVALLCSSSLDFLFSWLGLIRAGFAVLLIAPQCQAEAIAHLCKSCDAYTLIFDEAYHDLASSTAAHSEDITAVNIPWQPRKLSIYDITKNPEPFAAVSTATEHDVAYIHHTSGTSSGLPKPIPQTHHGGVAVLPSLYGEGAATFTTTPLYHGGVADCFRAWTSSALIWLFPANICPITTNNILACLQVSEKASITKSSPPIEYFSSVPYVLQMLAEDPSGVQMLQKMDIVGVGGAALPPHVGDNLVTRGVNLVSRFGSAECGFLLSSNRDYKTDHEWQYLRSSNSKLLRFEPQSDDSGLFELIVLPHWPHMAKRNRPDGSFATSDLFEPHPTIPGAWKYHSRSDSQITLLTGKKFDPAPIEDEIASRSTLLREVLVFGSGKQVPGALIFPSLGPVTPQHSLEDKIWDVVKAVNSESQNHTRISRDMILVLDAATPALARSSKGTLLRGAAEKTFAKEIEGLYAKSETKDHEIPYDGSGDVKSQVREVVNSLLEEPMHDDAADFYKTGVDSARCTQIRSVLQRRFLKEGETLPWNIVYDCGTVDRLAQYIKNSRGGEQDDSKTGEQEIRDLVQRYSHIGPKEKQRNVQNNSSPLGAVLLTGATGALGAHILDILRQDSSITTIYCLVRAYDRDTARARVSESLIKRRKKPLSHNDEIHCLPTQLGQSDLGIQKDLLSRIRSEVTHVIHAAWTVNFSLPLRSFEDDNIVGLYNLIKFAISCHNPAQVAFCSSTASVLGKSHPPVLPETISSSPLDADSLGYSKSKWVAEAICAAASGHEEMAGRIKILRIGQLTGDTINGVWNMSEAWPLMLSTVDVVGCLPQRKDKLSWLPLDVAAQTVVDIAIGDGTSVNPGQSCQVFHVVNNSRGTSWEDLLKWIREVRSEKFETVEPQIWLRKVEELESHPAKNLLWLWQKGRGDETSESRDSTNVYFEVSNAEKASLAMRSVSPVDQDLVQKIWKWLEEEMKQV